MSTYSSPEMPTVQSRHQGGKQKPTAIILRGAFTTSSDGAALGLANAWHKGPDPWRSGHYTIDDRSRFRCTPDDVVAGAEEWATKGAILIAICAEPVTGSVFWDSGLHRDVLNRTAELVAELTLAHKIQHHYLEPKSAEGWIRKPSRRRGGIIVETTSGWPFQEFIDEVKAQRALKSHI